MWEKIKAAFVVTERTKHYGELVAVVGGGLLVVVAGISGYRWLTAPPVDTTVAVIAPVAPKVAKVKRVTTQVKSVQTFAPAAKLKLNLPPPVITNEQQQVTGATTVAPSERRQTVTSVLDIATGETTTFVKPEPQPWFALEHRGEARFDYGYKIQRGSPTPAPVGRLSITHDFAQIKAVHIGVNLAVDTDRSAFAGVGIGYRW